MAWHTCMNSFGGCCDIKKPFYVDTPSNSRKKKVSTSVIWTISLIWDHHVAIVARGVQITEASQHRDRGEENKGKPTKAIDLYIPTSEREGKRAPVVDTLLNCCDIPQL